MYTYRNKKTARVVKTTCRVIGNTWELVASEPPQAEKQAKPRKTKKVTKAGGDDG